MTYLERLKALVQGRSEQDDPALHQVTLTRYRGWSWKCSCGESDDSRQRHQESRLAAHTHFEKVDCGRIVRTLDNSDWEPKVPQWTDPESIEWLPEHEWNFYLEPEGPATRDAVDAGIMDGPVSSETIPVWAIHNGRIVWMMTDYERQEPCHPGCDFNHSSRCCALCHLFGTIGQCVSLKEHGWYHAEEIRQRFGWCAELREYRLDPYLTRLGMVQQVMLIERARRTRRLAERVRTSR